MEKIIIFGLLLIAFQRVYLTDGTTCGFVSTATNVVQTFSTPNYPQHYPNGQRCLWNFSAPAGSRVRVDFIQFRTEDCCDYLSILQRSGEVSTVRGELTFHEYLISEDSWMALRFFSDNEFADIGFHATYRVTDEPPQLNVKCGFHAIASNEPKVIRSPGWPSPYVDDLYCVWNISARPGYRIKVEMNYFETETCCDVLAFLESGFDVLRIKGNVPVIPPFVSTSNHLIMEFFSDDDVVYNGFSATFTETQEPTYLFAECGNTVMEATTTPKSIFSPGYPGPYENNLNCSWYIETEPQNVINISLIFFFTEKCCDNLTVFDGDGQAGVQLGVVQPQHKTILSTTNRARIQFVSDFSTNYLGFLLNFTSIYLTHTPPDNDQDSTNGGSSETNELNSNVVCGFGARATSVRKPITSPNWPAFYPTNVACEWTLVARPGLRVELAFSVFNTEKCCDFLSIMEDNRELLKLQGNLAIPSPLVSKTNRLVLMFSSDNNVIKQGFQATFRETNRRFQLPYAPCEGDYIATSTPQFIRSPGSPLPYDSNLNCSWIIRARAGFRIQIDFGLFDTEKCCDYLEGIDEGREAFKIRGNSTNIPHYISSNNILRLRFESDNSINGDGFQLRFRETILYPESFGAPCGFTGMSSRIFMDLNSPRWPARYDDGLDCYWNITGKPGRRIQLQISSFDTELCCDYLDVFDGNKQMLRLAGELTVQQKLNTTSNVLRLHFHSDSTFVRRGFQTRFRELIN